MHEVDLISAALQLAPQAKAAARQTEQDRHLSPDLVAALARAGLFRQCVPENVGGVEAPPTTLIETVEALARADGATGWCVAIGATSGLLAGYLPPDAARTIHATPTTITGGVFAPRGRAVQVDGGYRVAGRWPFASGSTHCDWLMGGCLVAEGDGLRMLESGAPDIRLMLAPRHDVTIHDTWDTVGLRGTASHDIELTDVFIPADHGASVFTDEPIATGPLYALPLFGLLAVGIGAVCAGLARGALDDLHEIATKRVPAGGRRSLAERGTAQAETAKAEADTRAARALLHAAVEAAWTEATTDGTVSTEHRTGLRLAAAHCARTATAVTETCFRLGGGSAVYNDSPLGRRMRDAQTAAQHMLVAPTVWELTGRLLLGQPTDTSQL
jgi:alkylation response protein AidB-like acyl-CoA dehydrogenase